MNGSGVKEDPGSQSTVYRFGEFRLDPAARELWQGDELAELARRTFDGLVFLVEHRDRAVSRDELIEALWGRPVEDIQVTQLVMRLRRLLGDDSHEPRFIRAVPGFGYRWIAEPDEIEQSEDAPDSSDGAASASHSAADAVPWNRRRWLMTLVLFAAALLAAAAAYLVYSHLRQAAPLSRELGKAIVVMPLEINDSGQTDIGWARLGAMDLIAERMRDAGLPVPPSENVISALQAVAERPESDSLSALRRALGAEILVQGAVRQADGGWIVELTATTSAGHARRIESDPADIIPAARRAANLLLAVLGHQASEGENGDEALSERLQRARAAGLALELDTARAILTEAPEAMRDEPELRHELAWVEMRAGRPEAVMAITAELLDDPAIKAQPRLHARVLIAHGVAHVRKSGTWQAGEPYFDAVVAVLDKEPWAPELGRALAMRSAAQTIRQRFDDAARDLGRARTLFEAGGDRAGMAQVENYSGNLELARGRPNDALSHFRNAIEIDAGFSNIDGLRANLSAMQRAQMQLLRWSDALETSERLWKLHDQFQEPVDPHRRHSLQMHRVEVLIALGRQREAEAILSGVAGFQADIPAYGLRYEMELRARLAWQQGDWERARHASGQALELWRSDARPAVQPPTELVLLHQRASVMAGPPVPVADVLPAGSDTEDAAAYLARAEWAAYREDHTAAERYFRQAALQAESRAVPALFVLVADAYARWLLTHDRVSEALAVAGRVARWAEEDYDSALLQLVVLHASERAEAWAVALSRAQRLAGERELPAELLRMPE